jgi:hypothetical protein
MLVFSFQQKYTSLIATNPERFWVFPSRAVQITLSEEHDGRHCPKENSYGQTVNLKNNSNN